MDQITGSGRAAATLGQPPAVEGEIALARLDLDPYLPADSEPPVDSAAGTGGPRPAGPTTPITLPLPLPSMSTCAPRGEREGAPDRDRRPNADCKPDRQQAAVTLDELQAYGGRLAGSAKATPGSPPAYAVDLQAQGVQPARRIAGACSARDGSTDRRAVRAALTTARQQSAPAGAGASAATARSCCATAPSSASTSPACCARS